MKQLTVVFVMLCIFACSSEDIVSTVGESVKSRLMKWLYKPSIYLIALKLWIIFIALLVRWLRHDQNYQEEGIFFLIIGILN